MANWIKCSERMPGDSRDVKFYSQSNFECKGYRFPWTIGNKFYTSSGEHGGLCEDVIYWQPLPEPPQE